ncbi:MAG: type II secretion system F family protein [Clostridium sp.]|uniref:type II secretion system F family protein n=1 Tax=Clostridium sp. TaxID=1506 RepID=UPI0039ED5489
MKLFKFRAINNSGKSFKGLNYYKNEDDLSFQLREQGYYLLQCKSIHKSTYLKHFSKINLKDISVFSRQLSSMLSAGFNISEALNIFSEETYSRALKKNIKDIKEDLEKGNSFYDSISKYKNSYPNFYMEMINLGEQSGNLDTILKSMSKYYLKEFKIKRSFKSAMVYPIILLITSVTIFFYLEINVIPMFRDTFKSLGQDLPIYSMMLMNFSKFLIENRVGIIFIIIFFIFLIYKALNIEKVKIYFDKVKISIPILGNFYKKILGSRFTRCFGILQQSGINLINSIDIISRVVDNAYVEKELKKAMVDIRKGNSIAETMDKLNVFPKFTISMMALGEQAGNLEDMMLLAADIYDDDIEDILGKIISSIEPAMIIILSFIVGIVVISVMLPMLKIMQAV